MENKKVPHVHAEFIKAWADGAEIEYLHSSGWRGVVGAPSWVNHNEYRIKPEPKWRPFKNEDEASVAVGKIIKTQSKSPHAPYKGIFGATADSKVFCPGLPVYSFGQIFYHFELEDGTPLGILEN